MMVNFQSKSVDELRALNSEFNSRYDELKLAGLNLDLTRGKPSPEQLDLSAGLFNLALQGDHTSKDGVDVRNYGGTAGILDLREIFAELLEVPVANLIAGGNASLEMMHDVIVFSLLHGTVDSSSPLVGQGKIKFLCPAPGYDRHFAICEHLGIEMIPIEMLPDGPNLNQVAELIANDEAIKGIWVVPTYSNPTGAVCTPEVIKKLIELPAAASDFRIFFDDAYAVHTLVDAPPVRTDILGIAQAAGVPHRPLIFASTSKITFAGAGVAFLAASEENLNWYQKHLGIKSIGPDKVNQLRHARYFGDAAGVRKLMGQHREILAPKFQLVLEILESRLADAKVASWTKPEGGYFISLDVLDGTASKVISLAKNAGIALTAAGSAFPYKTDPDDRNIRLAPSFPNQHDLAAAMDGVATCVLLAATDKLLAQTEGVSQ